MSLKEITNAVKELNKNKTPGADGLPVEVYIMFWNILKHPLLEALNFAYEKGELHESALNGIISLIPKSGRDSRIIKNLRPITLLNTDYKILEKCLANRLKIKLPQIINEDQKGFMSDRRIGNNIRRIIDAVQMCKREDLPIAIISIDAEKAFDRVELDSLIGVLEYFNIGKSFQKWVRVCFHNAKAAVINGGRVSQKINITRGVKQGGCCSAFFF